ncbi:MAG: DEAD/DEAH box helicase [Thermodesulfobacteriota bacterium]
MAEQKLTVAAECLLAHGDPSLTAALRRELTIANPKYRDAVKYGRWVGKKLKPNLTFFKEDGAGLHFPRGFANEAVRLAQGLDLPPLAVLDKRGSKEEVDLSCQASLRPYQEEAVAKVLARQFGVLESGTGSGKTVMALAVIAARRQPTLILVHTKELLYQWQERIKQFMGLEAALVGDGHHDLGPLTVAIVNSARRRLPELTPYFGHLVVDECHRVPASLFTEVVTAFDCCFMLGLSATAFRRDGLSRLINIYLGDLVHRVDGGDLAASGAVLRPKLIQHPTTFTFRYRDNYQDMLKALTSDLDRNGQIVADICQEAKASAHAILVVSDRVAHCQEIVAQLTAAGVQAGLLTGRTSSDERLAVVEQVKGGQLRVLVSTIQLIGEGFDCPGLATLFLTTPIKFSGRLLQVVGRILRPAQDKEARVHDYVDQEVGILARSAEIRRQNLLPA